MSRSFKRFLTTGLLGLFVLSSLLAACAPQATPTAAPAAEVTEAPAAEAPATEAPAAEAPVAEEDLQVVRVGMTPFFEYHYSTVASELGWDKELGLKLEFTWLTQSGPSIQALANGSIDTANTCIVCNFPFYESVPNLMNFINTDQFKGFIVIGRKGQVKTYDEFLTELGDPEKAKKATIEQFRGKTWPIYRANYEPLLTATLGQAGMTIDDVEILNFPDDEKSALAMIGGTGDFYMGGLPAEINLLLNHSDQFVLVGGADILGPAGLWYSNIASTEEWLAENEETALKLMAMSYRYNRYMNEKPDVVLPIILKAMNDHSGAQMSQDELKFVFENFVGPRTYQEDKETALNPDSDLYWGVSAEYYVKNSTELPEDADYRRNNPVDEWFAKFLARPDLLEWVDAPLE
jgi:ABC-type nitrate/sulfonate/bicarbonate transport system substrate-binding protein